LRHFLPSFQAIFIGLVTFILALQHPFFICDPKKGQEEDWNAKGPI